MTFFLSKYNLNCICWPVAEYSRELCACMGRAAHNKTVSIAHTPDANV